MGEYVEYDRGAAMEKYSPHFFDRMAYEWVKASDRFRQKSFSRFERTCIVLQLLFIIGFLLYGCKVEYYFPPIAVVMTTVLIVDWAFAFWSLIWLLMNRLPACPYGSDFRYEFGGDAVFNHKSLSPCQACDRFGISYDIFGDDTDIMRGALHNFRGPWRRADDIVDDKQHRMTFVMNDNDCEGEYDMECEIVEEYRQKLELDDMLMKGMEKMSFQL